MDASAVELNFFMSLKYFSWIAAVIHQNISLVATLSNTKMKRIFIKITSHLNFLTDGRCCVSVSTYLVHMKQLRISYELIKPCDAMIKLIAFMEMWYLGATRSWWGLTNWNCCTMVARDKTQFARNVSHLTSHQQSFEPETINSSDDLQYVGLENITSCSADPGQYLDHPDWSWWVSLIIF